MKRDTIICICHGYSKPVINTIKCDQIIGNNDEIVFEIAKKFNGNTFKADTITFYNAEDFWNFWNYIMKNYIK